MQLLLYSLFFVLNWNFLFPSVSLVEKKTNTSEFKVSSRTSAHEDFLSLNTSSFYDNLAGKPQFKLTNRGIPEGCSQGGCSFDRGYVSTRSSDWVLVAMYVQKKGGYWEKKEYTRQGAGYIELKLSDCDYTGNYYAFACFQKDGTCSFPDVYKVEEMHKKRDHTPKFKVLKVSDLPCEGEKGAAVEKGYVYSPLGSQVEITLFMEKKDGSWRKKTYLYFGTGMIEMDMKGCDLTGNYKATIRYAD